MFIALYNLAGKHPKELRSIVRRLSKIRVLDTEDGVIEKVPFDDAEQYTINLQRDGKDKMMYFIMSSFWCRALDLAYFFTVNRGTLFPTAYTLYYKGYMYSLETGINLMDIVDGCIMFVENRWGRLCIVRDGKIMTAGGDLFSEGEPCDLSTILRKVSLGSVKLI